MSDLVKRLRGGCNLQQRDGERAADRIEQLERELAAVKRANIYMDAQHQEARDQLIAEKALAYRRECPSSEVRP